MPPAECKAKSYREEGPIFFVTLSTPCTPLPARRSSFDLLWLRSTRRVGRFQNEIAAAIKIQSLARMGIAWNRADERRFEMKKCAPRRTRGACYYPYTIYEQLIPLWFIVRCTQLYFSFVFLTYLVFVYLMYIRTQLISVLFFCICLFDTWFEVFCHTRVIRACPVNTDSILAMR